MFYILTLNFYPKFDDIQTYYKIFIYGCVVYFAFYIILHSGIIDDNKVNKFIKDYFLYFVVIDGGYLTYHYLDFKHNKDSSVKIKNDKKSKKSGHDIFKKDDEQSDIFSETNNIKISHQSSNESSILFSNKSESLDLDL
jgi:hypothetical protein